MAVKESAVVTPGALTEALKAGLRDYKLLYLAAPTGWGKTTAVRHHFRARPHTYASLWDEDALDRAETAPEEYPDRALCMGICGLVRRRLENPGYLRDPDYGAALMDVFNRCRRELPIGYAAFHLPRVLEWLTAGRQYKQAYELLRDFPIKLPNLPV